MQGQGDSGMDQSLMAFTIEKSPFLTLKSLKTLIAFALPDLSSVIFKGALILV